RGDKIGWLYKLAKWVTGEMGWVKNGYVNLRESEVQHHERLHDHQELTSKGKEKVEDNGPRKFQITRSMMRRFTHLKYALLMRSDMTKDQDDLGKKEVGSTPNFQIPMLKITNYSLWAIRMQIILEANGLWETIEPSETTNSDTKKDKTTIAFLYQALPEEQLLQITKYKSSKDIWEALKNRHLGETRVQQARLQTLKYEFEMFHMKEDETIDAFTSKITTMGNKAATLGHTFEDSTLVQKLLNAIPDRYLQIIASIEQYADLSTMILEEAV
nr:zinc finger, CCHC-type [Tanacetum cinerariifolium]